MDSPIAENARRHQENRLQYAFDAARSIVSIDDVDDSVLKDIVSKAVDAVDNFDTLYG